MVFPLISTTCCNTLLYRCLYLSEITQTFFSDKILGFIVLGNTKIKYL